MTTCERYRESIQELIDGTLGSIRKAELEMHMDQCDECRAFATDLQRIRETAASLDRLAPPDRAWLQIAGRLRQEGRVVAAPALGARRHHVALLAIAAALAIAVGASVVLVLPHLRPATAPAGSGASAATRQGNAAAVDTVESVEAEFQLAEQHYQNAIAKLEQIAKSDPNAIDAQTAAALQKNQQVIDLAIAESRAALRKEPGSMAARDSLFDALKRKVALLQDTIALMNEMRKGNSTGAAQIVEGVNKS
jgi:anti-sigma factor RsiW